MDGRPSYRKVFADYDGAHKQVTGGIELHLHCLPILLDAMDAEAVLERPDSFVSMCLGLWIWIGLEVEKLNDDDLQGSPVDSYRNSASATLVRRLSEGELDPRHATRGSSHNVVVQRVSGGRARC